MERFIIGITEYWVVHFKQKPSTLVLPFTVAVILLIRFFRILFATSAIARCFGHFKWALKKSEQLLPIFSIIVHLSARRSGPGLGSLRPAWTFDMVRIRIVATQFRAQDCVKNKLHDKQLLRQ